MKYIKGNNQSLITRLLQQLSAISTAQALTYPHEPERLILPSLQVFAPLLSAFHRISSIRGWSTSRGIE